MKNSRKKRKQPEILVSTLNVRTLSNEAYLLELENAISKIKFDVIGLSEVKRNGEGIVETKDFSFYHFGTSTKLAGVGFLIHKKWKNNQKIFKSISSRVTTLTLSVNEKETLSVIQVYAPTSAAKIQEIEKFYSEIDDALDIVSKSTWKIIVGDFNSKIGIPQLHEKDVMGNFGFGTRNDRGEMQIRFVVSTD